MGDIHRGYLRDLGYRLREAAIDAKKEVSATHGADGAAFEAGRLQAYWKVVSLMLSQAKSFGLPADDLKLDGFSPDNDLL